MTDTPDTLFTALVRAQKNMPALQRDKINPAFSRGGNESKYLSLETLLTEVLPVLNEHGLAISQWPSFIVTESGEVVPTLETTLLHGPSGEAWKGSMLLMAQAKDPQKQGAAITYAKRQALMAALGLSADEDDDGNAASSQRGARKAAAASGPKAINAAQLRRLHTIVGTRGLSADAAKALIVEIAGVESSKEIPVAKYDELVARIEAFPLAAQ